MIEQTTLGFVPGGFFKVRMQFDPADPVAALFTFETNSGNIEWLFARELLWHGLTEFVGEGDVTIGPADDGNLLMSLSSPDGEQEVKLSHMDVEKFITDTLQAVSPKQEADMVEAAVDKEFA